MVAAVVGDADFDDDFDDDEQAANRRAAAATVVQELRSAHRRSVRKERVRRAGTPIGGDAGSSLG